MIAPFLLFTPGFFRLFALSLAVLLPALAAIARARGHSATLAAAVAFSVSLILAWTVPDAWLGLRPQDFLRAFAEPGAITEALRTVGHSEERQANVLLYVPAGLLTALLVRRFTPVAVGLSGLSWTIELAQAVSGVRDGSLPDWVYNTAGTVIGVTIAYVLFTVHSLIDMDRTR